MPEGAKSAANQRIPTPRSADEKARLFENRTWAEHQLMKSRNVDGKCPRRPCTCNLDTCTDFFVECWGEIIQPYFRRETKDGQVIQGGGSCGMTVEHLTAQQLIAGELNSGNKVTIDTKCKACKRLLPPTELVLSAEEECRVEAYYKSHSEFYSRERTNFADLGVVPKDSPVGTLPRAVIEVYQKNRTSEQNREGMQWFEVKAKQVVDQKDSVQDGNTLTLDCMRMLTHTCKRCEHKQRLQPFQTYLKQLHEAFPVRLKGYTSYYPDFKVHKSFQCVLCDGRSEISDYEGNYEARKLCPVHLKLLYKNVQEVASTPEIFFAEAHAIQATRVKEAKAEVTKEAERHRAEAAELEKRRAEMAERERVEAVELEKWRAERAERAREQKMARLKKKMAKQKVTKAKVRKQIEMLPEKKRLKELNRLESEAAGELRGKKLRMAEKEEISVEEIEEHVRKHWSKYRACFVSSHEYKLDRVILKLQMEERRCGVVEDIRK